MAKLSNREFHQRALRLSARAQYVQDLQEGKVRRAHTFKSKKKEASRTACRGKVEYDG